MHGGGSPVNYNAITTATAGGGLSNNYNGVKANLPNHSFSHSLSESPPRESSEEAAANLQQAHSANVSVANSKASNSSSIGKYITSCSGADMGTNV